MRTKRVAREEEKKEEDYSIKINIFDFHVYCLDLA